MLHKFMILVISWCFFLMFIDLFMPDRAMACSCAELPSMEEQLERKTAVFAGEVQSVTQPVSSFLSSSADPVKAVIQVKQVWKGDVAQKVAVYTALSSESCGYEGFTAGKEYIVFAYEDSGHLATGLCEGTKLLSEAQEELAWLGEGTTPKPSNSIDPGSLVNRSYGFIKPILFVGAAGIMVIVVILARRLTHRP